MKTFKDICDEMVSLYDRKNKDYGNSFDKSFEEFGLIAPIIRLSDKMNRIKQLNSSKEQNVKDEAIEDTLIDLAAYSIMTILQIKNKKN